MVKNDKQQRTPPTVVKKVGYDPSSDIKRGVCGYEGCKMKIDLVTKGASDISCPKHDSTHKISYSYLSKEDCQKKYNSDAKFSECVNSSCGCIHDGDETPCKEGRMSDNKEHFQKSSRVYGAWSVKDLHVN